MNKNTFLKRVFKAVDASGSEKKIIEAVLDIIPQEALEVLGDRKEFFDAFITAIKKSFFDPDIAASFLAEELLSRFKIDEDILGENVLANSRKKLIITSLVCVGYLKLYGDVEMEYLKRRDIASELTYVARKYKSLENLEEKLKEVREWENLVSFYRNTELYFNNFLFFIEKVSGIKVEALDGEEVEDNLANIKNIREINETLPSQSVDFYRKRGEENLNALKTQFPFTRKVLEYISSGRNYSQLILLLGAYTKEEFLEAFGKNYMDLNKRIVRGLEEHPYVTLATFHKTLYNQKDLFGCEQFDIITPPYFPQKVLIYDIPIYECTSVITKNGYEYLAAKFLSEVPRIARYVYFERYKDEPSKLLDLYLVSLYYKYTKNLDLADFSNAKKDLNNLLDTIEKNIREDKKKILEVLL